MNSRMEKVTVSLTEIELHAMRSQGAGGAECEQG